MESRNGASSEGFLIPVSESSDVFQGNILAPLQSAYLYDESKQFFRYKSAVIVKNPDLENKYEAFRAKKRNAGYSEEDLKETYGFLLFDDGCKANALGETGVISGNSTCTTLGDPAKGVYISMYSDCLDLNRWYHGKSGYIAIIRLTKGKVRKVAENYTQNFTEPTVGFDCHVSEQLPSVSAKTSSFLAFERTQFYIYELLCDGSSETSLSPSAACPVAIVSFSYMDTKALGVPQEKSELNKPVHHYLLWRGQLQIEGQLHNIDLRSPAVAFIPVQLPSVIKVNQAIHLAVLRTLLPRAVFETSYTEEAFLDGLYCHLCEFVSSEASEVSSFALLLSDLKEKDLAFTIPLNDRGFLILMHASHFLRYDEAESASTKVLQGLFVFPDSRVVRRDTKFQEKNSALSYDVLRALPVLSYAEGEAEKMSTKPNDELCEVLTQLMESYAMLINPGLSSSPSRPSRELSMFPDQYDMAEAHKHLYSSPDLNSRTCEILKSYLSKPASFQLPIAKISEILASGQDGRREELDEDVYICLSSPEAPTSPVCTEAVDQLSDEQSTGNIETSMDIGSPNAVSPIAATPVSQCIVADNVQIKNVSKGDQESPHISEQPTKTDSPGTQDPLTTPTSEDIPAELIVSITSAEQSVSDEASTAKHTDFPVSDLSTMAKSQPVEVNSVIDRSDKAKKCLDYPKATKGQIGTKRKKRRRIYSTLKKKVSKNAVKAHCLKTAVSSAEVEHLNCEHSEEINLPQLRNSLKAKWRKLHRQKHKFVKLSSKPMKLRSTAVDSVITEKKKTDNGLMILESPTILGVEALPLRKKTERWDLKPVVSECGRILFPFGSVDFADKVKFMQSTSKEECLEKLSQDVPVNLTETDVTDKQLGTASATAASEGAPTTSVCDEYSSLHPGVGVILTLPVDDSGRVPLTPDFCSANPKKDDSFSSNRVDIEKLENFSPVKLSPKGELLLSKLKSVLSRRKRTFDLTMTPHNGDNADQGSESCFKKSKEDSDTEPPKSNTQTPQSVSVTKVVSVDPLFAYCLGLTPKENLENFQKTKEMNTLQKNDSTEKEEQASLDKQSQIIQKPLSIFPRGSRIKTLRRHQGVSAENVKKKWWLHFQSPASFTSEKKYNDCTNDNTVRKTFKRKKTSTCTSTDALNLLADLALSNDKVSPQPNQAPERAPKESEKKCGFSKSLSSADQESVLHALLRNPSTIALHSLEPPSKCSSVAENNLVDLISKDHAYSLPPSSLLLDLSGTSIQVPPLSGSTRLLNHHQTVYDDGAKTLHPSDSMGDINEHSKTSEYLYKHRRKFKHSRTFVIKEKSIQVTRKWEEDYNFNLDSKFTSDPKDKVIIRALHGPWDLSMQDTAEEVRLIFHMWIGLFYSRSTSRFFQVDPTLMQPCSEESRSLEKASGMWSCQSRPELEICLTETPGSVISELLDLSKKENTVSAPESVILDLSVKNVDATPVPLEQQFHNKVIPVSSEPQKTMSALKPVADLQEKEKIQFQKEMVNFKDITSKVKDDKSSQAKTTETEPSLLSFDHKEAPYSKCDMISRQSEERKNISILPETDGATFGIKPVLHGCSKGCSFEKVGIENAKAAVKSLPQEEALSSPKSVDKEENNIEESSVVHKGVLDDVQLKAKESCQMENNQCQDGNSGPSLDTVNKNDEPVNKESDIICNEKVVNEKLSSKQSLFLLDDNKERNTEYCTRPSANLSCKVKDDKSSQAKTTETEPSLLSFDDKEEPCSKCDRISCQSEEMKNVPILPEMDGATFGIQPVLHGCSKGSSFEKVGIEDAKATEKSLPQVEALSSPISVMDKEVNNIEETIVVHEGVLVKAMESCQMEKNQCQVSKRGPSLDTVNKNDEPLNKVFDIFCNKNFVNEKVLSKDSQFSLDDNQEGNMDCCTRPTAKEFKNEDVCVKKDESDGSESCISPAGFERDLRNPSLPKLSDGLLQQCYISESSQIDKQFPLSEDTEDPLCVNPIVAKDESPIFETCSTPSEIEPVFNETAPQENLDTNKNDCQNVVLPILGEGSNSFDDSPTVLSFSQEKDSVESPNRKEASDLGFYSCNDQKSLESKSAHEEEILDQTLPEPQESPSKGEVKNVCEVAEQFTEKDDLGNDETSSRPSKSLILVSNPCIAKDVPSVNAEPLQDVMEKAVQYQEPVPFICEATEAVAAQPDQMSESKISLTDDTVTSEVFRKEFDSRSSTPTIDEKPCEFNVFPISSSSTGVLRDSEDCQNGTENSTPSMDELPLKQKLQDSTGNTDPNPLLGLGFDVRIRTLRVLQSLNTFLGTPNNQKSPVDQDFHSYRSFVSGEVLQEDQKISQANLSNRSYLHSQRPVVAVKPSKYEDSQAHWPSKDIDPKTISQCKKDGDHKVRNLLPTSLSLKETKQFNKSFDALNSNYSVCQPSPKTTLLTSTTYSKSDTGKHTVSRFTPLKAKRTMLSLNQIHSSPQSSAQCPKSYKSCPVLEDGHKRFMKCTVNGTGEDITKHVNQRYSSDKSFIYDKYTSSEDGHIASPQTSLMCTVFNTGEKRPYSFLEQISQRCLQNDLTQASMEQECLIFSQQMKNLLKKRKREPLHPPDTIDSSVSCSSPMTISFSNLEEQEDSKEILDTPLVRLKMQVDMPNSKDRSALTDEEKVDHSLSQENNNSMEHAGISAMTAECARLYNAKMHDVCSAKKVSPRCKTKKGHQKDPRTDATNHFDFCDQMKKELDENFKSNLNAVVKKSCKTKYRFYILVTSVEAFFKETKAQLDSKGHSAVQPSEFFLGEDSSSSLLIILRNEDIAEHICKIPHLLRLKMTPGVLFAGIDEPDDVTNLTHQELFTRGGFVMFDRAVLEPLSISDMKKISEILQELNRIGKWKWMLHYRDSRRLKEDARLSEEANKKKLFMYWCQDAGILEVLPYHECDQMTKDKPDYLACLLRLQVQHISSRFPVFITDATTDSAFEKNGILTMTLNTFLTKSSTEIFSV